MKNRIARILAAFTLLALPAFLTAQVPQVTNTAQAGVTLFVSIPATATATGASRLPTFSGTGTLTVVESGITGSPSGCTIVLAYVTNAAATATSTVSTTSFTPSTGVQTFTISPSVASGDNYQATYSCSSTYPTAGLLTATFSPTAASQAVTITSGTVTNSPATTLADPCQNPSIAKSSAEINVSSATTTQLVALSGTKKIYVCDVTMSLVGTSPSAQFISGTGSACGTVDQTFTGAMVASATVGVIHLGYGGSIAVTTGGDELCLVSGATVTTETGIVTYVQQ